MKKRHRALALFMAALLTLNLFPATAFASGSGDSQPDCPICGHIHDEKCNYQKPVEEQPCSHTHDESCGYKKASEEIPCQHECTEASENIPAAPEKLPENTEDIPTAPDDTLESTEGTPEEPSELPESSEDVPAPAPEYVKTIRGRSLLHSSSRLRQQCT